jgi:hypothetical protein
MSSEKKFVLPPDKVPQPAMEGRETKNGEATDRRFHEESMGTNGGAEDEDLDALREFIRKS